LKYVGAIAAIQKCTLSFPGERGQDSLLKGGNLQALRDKVNRQHACTTTMRVWWYHANATEVGEDIQQAAQGQFKSFGETRLCNASATASGGPPPYGQNNFSLQNLAPFSLFSLKTQNLGGARAQVVVRVWIIGENSTLTLLIPHGINSNSQGHKNVCTL